MLGFVHYNSPSATTEFNQDFCFTPTHNTSNDTHPTKIQRNYSSNLPVPVSVMKDQNILIYPWEKLIFSNHFCDQDRNPSIQLICFPHDFPFKMKDVALLCTCSRYNTQFHPNPRHNSSVYPIKKNYLRYSLVSAVLLLVVLNTPQTHCRTDTIALMWNSYYSV